MQLGDDVILVGKESDDQKAQITHFIARVKVKINNTYYSFGNIFEIQPRQVMYIGSLSKEGDSGSWVIRENKNTGVADELCGVLIAGDGTKRSLCCFIEDVLAELKNLASSTFSVY